jgi:transcription antitermination factor NusG
VLEAPGRGRPEPPAALPVRRAAWYVLWTRSYCEQLVRDQLASRGFRPFLPFIDVWSRRGGQRHVIQTPMFPGYLFLHHALDKFSDTEVRKTRGLVTILGESWERRAVVPEAEIQAIERLGASGLPVAHHPYLREGQRVRITRGPMAEVEGLLVRANSRKGLVVLSVDLLQRSVAVEVDCTLVAAL